MNYQDRVKEESTQLGVKIRGLEKFVDSTEFLNIVVSEQARLRCQLIAMDNYYGILKQRILRF